MREILFRGKRIDNGEWIEGVPIKTHIGTFIVFEENPHYCGQYGYMEIDKLAKVIPKTVGQYTGLTDKNGKRIFEGDICRMRCDGLSGYGEIQFRHGCFGIADKKRKRFYYLEDNSEYMVIGNIHDNPELVEVSGDD